MARTAIVYDLIAKDNASRNFRKVAGAADHSDSKLRKLAGAAGLAAKFVGAAGVAAAGAATVIGVKAASNIDHAQRTLTGLYGSAEQANKTLKLLRKTASKSPIDAEAFRKGAEQLAYMGIKGGEANQTLKNIAGAIVAVGGTSEDMGRVTDAMLQMQNSGKVYADQLNQISQAGVPIFSGLAKHFNTNIKHVREMVESGKVSIKDVMAVVRKAEGGTFKQMLRASKETSKSFSAQWSRAKDNVREALGRAFLPLIKNLTPFIKKIGTQAPRAVGTLSKKLQGLDIGKRFRKSASFITDFFKGLTTDIDKTTSRVGVGDFLEKSVPTTAGGKAGAKLRKTFKGLFSGAIDSKSLGKKLGDAFGKAVTHLGGLGSKFGKSIAKILGGIDWTTLGGKVGGGAIGFALGFIAHRSEEHTV